MIRIGPRSITTHAASVTGGVFRERWWRRRVQWAPGDAMNVVTCVKCNTPLDAESGCVTCTAAEGGLALISRSGYASVREMMELLEGQDLAPEIEQVPPRRPEEKARPLWNIYVPTDEVPRAVEFLRKDWAELIGDPAAAAAAERGTHDIDLDAGGEIECPACGHRFLASASHAECPDCGLGLGVPSEAAPDEAEH
jgi:hypothetical protein